MTRILLEIEVPEEGEERICDHLRAVLENYGVRYEIGAQRLPINAYLDLLSHTHYGGGDWHTPSHDHRHGNQVVHAIEGNHVHHSPPNGFKLPEPPEDFIEEGEMKI